MRAVAATQEVADLRYPPAPDGYTIYIVGDIHGRLDLLLDTLQLIDADKAASPSEQSAEIYLGDYIDRGPDSAGVVARLIGRGQTTNAYFLRGNHEQMLLSFMEGADCLAGWHSVGAKPTLRSYGVPEELLLQSAAPEAVRRSLSDCIPPEHYNFYEQTGSYMRVGAYLAVHAGVRPSVRLEDQKTSDLLGIRQEFLRYDGDFDFIVVHGHTPVQAPDFRHNRINIDTGAFATNRLTCLRIGAGGVRIL
jgi:serine/threonine protein phosphatase 1